MSKEYNGIKLPRAILDEIDSTERNGGSLLKNNRKRKNGLTRVEMRKLERKEKKQRRSEKSSMENGKINRNSLKIDKKAVKTEKQVRFVDQEESESETGESLQESSNDEENADDVMAKLAALKAKKMNKSKQSNDSIQQRGTTRRKNAAGFDEFKKSEDDSNKQQQFETESAKLSKDENSAAHVTKKTSTKSPRHISSHDGELIAQDEAEMEHYAKKLKLKSWKLSSQDDGLDDILGDLDFENFASGSESEEEEEMKDESKQKEDSHHEDENSSIVKRKKENPYIAPTSSARLSQTGTYVPPGKRATAQTTESDDAIRLRRQLKGLLNRLSDSNIASVVNSISELYSTNSRHQMNKTLTSIIIESISMQGTLLSGFLLTYAALATALFRSMGVEFGAVFLQTLVEEFETEAAKPMTFEHKQAVNLLSLMMEIYSFQMVSYKLIYGFVRQFIDNFNEANAELLLQVIKKAGSQLRNDDPASLKDIILLLKEKIAGRESGDLSSRTKFLLESITDLKNNKHRVSNEVNTDVIHKLKKFLGSFGKGEPLQVSLEDLHNVETKGKWWIVGAAWNNSELTHSRDTKAVDNDNLDINEVNWTELARNERMNTDIRRAIFVAIMSSEDFADAYERLQRLNLKNKQERDIPRVILHCCAGEKTYNPFYAFLAGKFCESRSFKKTFQFALWDYFTSLEDGDEDTESEKSQQKNMNYARFFGFLVAKRLITLDILKPINFLTAGPGMKLFCELLLITVYSNVGKETEKVHQVGLRNMTEIQRNPETLAKIFMNTKDTTTLKGLQYFQETVKNSSLVTTTKQKDRVAWGCSLAVKIIDEILSIRKHEQ